METTYTKLRDNLATVLDRVVDDQEVVYVRRRGARDVALVPARELESMMETAYLLQSPRNARRLRSAIARARKGEGRKMSVDQLRRELGLGAAR